MFFIMLLLWVVFNGKVTAEILIFGVLVSGAIYLFICKVMGYSYRNDLNILKVSWQLIVYIGVLFAEVWKANIQVMSLVLSRKPEIEPGLHYFTTDLKHEGSRVLLANSITLTPGTITAGLIGDRYCVHALDNSFAEGMDDSVFVKHLRKMEGKLDG